MPSDEKRAKKGAYFDKLVGLLEAYPQVLVVHADHVGSKQMADVRRALRDKAVILMGKNTRMRTALRKNVDRIPQSDRLVSCIKQNIGLVFCMKSMEEVRKGILEHKVPAPARQGVIAPLDVSIPPGPTGMDPSQTSFFQALGISTKIVKGQIEIQTDVDIIKKGDKVTASQSVLLQKLNLKPFSYGLELRQVYDDGSVYDASVLELSDSDILDKFSKGVQNVAALSRQVGIPTKASASHCIVEGFKHATALVLNTNYKFKQMEKLKEMIDNPDAFKVAAAPQKADETKQVETKKAESVKSDSSEEGDMGFDLFG